MRILKISSNSGSRVFRDALDVSRLYEGRAEQADNLIENFNKAILDCLSQLKEKTNEYLKIFNTHLEIDIPENPSLLQRDRIEIWGGN